MYKIALITKAQQILKTLVQGFLTGGKFTPGVNFAYPGGKFTEL